VVVKAASFWVTGSAHSLGQDRAGNAPALIDSVPSLGNAVLGPVHAYRVNGKRLRIVWMHHCIFTSSSQLVDAKTMNIFLRFGLLATTLSLSLSALADPAVVYDMGGKFDKSFNEAAYQGLEKWKKDTGKGYLEFEIANEGQREQALRRMAERGANPIIGVGFNQAAAIEKVAGKRRNLQSVAETIERRIAAD
jgi:hypothetical protein